MADNYLEKLNNEQKEAVLHKQGPLLIVAGAGTGKTTVIASRLSNLIEKGIIKSDEILAVTFTEKAAGEMEERVDQLLPFGYLDLWVSTFHAFCERILKEHALDIGLSNNFKLLDQTGAWVLIKQNFDKFNLDYYKPLGSPTSFIHALIKHFSRCKDEVIYPEDYLQYADDIKRNFDTGVFSKKDEAEIEVQRINEIADAYHIYQKLLLENNALDFSDLINYCIKLFEQRPTILKKYQEQFKYILVDEFQDTNWAQYQLIKKLALPNNNLTVCADDNQAIYRFRGASVSNVLQFQKDYPKSRAIVLTNNYRSTQDILDLSYNFIQLNNPNTLECQGGFSKKLKADNSEKGIIQHLHFKTSEDETSGVVKKILDILKQDKTANYSDFVVLCRTNEAASTFSKEFERQRLPYEFLASYGLYTQPVILDIISYLKLLDNYHESSALSRVLNLPMLDIPWQDLAKINEYSKKKAQSTYETLTEISLVSGLDKQTFQKINQLLILIKKHTELVKIRSVSDIALMFLKESEYLKYLVKNERDREIELVTQFYNKLKDFEKTNLDASVSNFVGLLDMELESGETGGLDFDIEKGPDAVKIMTIHSGKGLEFKYVFVVNLVDRRFPTTERKEAIEIPEKLIKEILPTGDVHLQEERRLFYVAITRAKKGVFFSSADNYGGKTKKRISRFLQELDLKSSMIEQTASLSKEKNLPPALEKKFLPKHFSFTQFIAFEKCPLQYKFAHILRIPSRGKGVFSFGKTIHNTLFQYLDGTKTNQKDLFGKELEQSNDLKAMLKLYESNWIDEWYESKEQKDEYFKLGREILKNFLKDFKKPEVLGLELAFRLKLGDDIIKGKVDRVDKIDDGMEIIDYKTGKSKEKLTTEEKNQLLIYQMALNDIFKQLPEKLTFYYLNDNKKISFQSTEKQRDELKEKLKEKIKAIKESNFSPTPGWQCKSCDFKDICEFRKS
ncbi:ATP-dependent helicase [Patescibacteria group bacterium]|nr:ATP-dependent helicase [Patescibacteria group bacterium]